MFVSVVTSAILELVAQTASPVCCKAMKSKSLLLTSVITPTQVLVSLKIELQVLSL
nr:MAG TPA: hypothetical protein [Bacteriophage sp.]